MIESQDSNRGVVPLSRRYRRAVIDSAIFHVGLLLALLYLDHPSQQSAAKSCRLEEAQRKLEVLPAENRSNAAPQDTHAERIRASIKSQIDASSLPISESEGQTAFETFEKLKLYPVADSIYRQLVMPMLQQVLESK